MWPLAVAAGTGSGGSRVRSMGPVVSTSDRWRVPVGWGSPSLRPARRRPAFARVVTVPGRLAGGLAGAHRDVGADGRQHVVGDAVDQPGTASAARGDVDRDLDERCRDHSAAERPSLAGRRGRRRRAEAEHHAVPVTGHLAGAPADLAAGAGHGQRRHAVAVVVLQHPQHPVDAGARDGLPQGGHEGLVGDVVEEQPTALGADQQAGTSDVPHVRCHPIGLFRCLDRPHWVTIVIQGEPVVRERARLCSASRGCLGIHRGIHGASEGKETACRSGVTCNADARRTAWVGVVGRARGGRERRRRVRRPGRRLPGPHRRAERRRHLGDQQPRRLLRPHQQADRRARRHRLLPARLQPRHRPGRLVGRRDRPLRGDRRAARPRADAGAGR